MFTRKHETPAMMASASGGIGLVSILLLLLCCGCATSEQQNLPYRTEVRVGMTQGDVLQLYMAAKDPEDSSSFPRTEVVDAQETGDEKRRTLRFWLLDESSRNGFLRLGEYEPTPFLLTFTQYRPGKQENMVALQKLVDDLYRRGELTEEKMAELFARQVREPVLIKIERDGTR